MTDTNYTPDLSPETKQKFIRDYKKLFRSDKTYFLFKLLLLCSTLLFYTVISRLFFTVLSVIYSVIIFGLFVTIVVLEIIRRKQIEKQIRK